VTRAEALRRALASGYFARPEGATSRCPRCGRDVVADRIYGKSVAASRRSAFRYHLAVGGECDELL
jgi:hypothetical protein